MAGEIRLDPGEFLNLAEGWELKLVARGLLLLAREQGNELIAAAGDTVRRQSERAAHEAEVRELRARVRDLENLLNAAHAISAAERKELRALRRRKGLPESGSAESDGDAKPPLAVPSAAADP